MKNMSSSSINRQTHDRYAKELAYVANQVSQLEAETDWDFEQEKIFKEVSSWSDLQPIRVDWDWLETEENLRSDVGRVNMPIGYFDGGWDARGRSELPAASVRYGFKILSGRISDLVLQQFDYLWKSNCRDLVGRFQIKDQILFVLIITKKPSLKEIPLEEIAELKAEISTARKAFIERSKISIDGENRQNEEFVQILPEIVRKFINDRIAVIQRQQVEKEKKEQLERALLE